MRQVASHHRDCILVRSQFRKVQVEEGAQNILRLVISSESVGEEMQAEVQIEECSETALGLFRQL